MISISEANPVTNHRQNPKKTSKIDGQMLEHERVRSSDLAWRRVGSVGNLLIAHSSIPFARGGSQFAGGEEGEEWHRLLPSPSSSSSSPPLLFSSQPNYDELICFIKINSYFIIITTIFIVGNGLWARSTGDLFRARSLGKETNGPDSGLLRPVLFLENGLTLTLPSSGGKAMATRFAVS